MNNLVFEVLYWIQITLMIVVLWNFVVLVIIKNKSTKLLKESKQVNNEIKSLLSKGR